MVRVLRVLRRSGCKCVSKHAKAVKGVKHAYAPALNKGFVALDLYEATIGRKEKSLPVGIGNRTIGFESRIVLEEAREGRERAMGRG